MTIEPDGPWDVDAVDYSRSIDPIPNPSDGGGYPYDPFDPATGNTGFDMPIHRTLFPGIFGDPDNDNGDGDTFFQDIWNFFTDPGAEDVATAPTAPPIGEGIVSGAIPGCAGVGVPAHCLPRARGPSISQTRSAILKRAGARFGQCSLKYSTVRNFINWAGPSYAARFLCLNDAQINFLILHPQKARQRGITPRQIRSANRTRRKAASIISQLDCGCAPKKRRKKKVC